MKQWFGLGHPERVLNEEVRVLRDCLWALGVYRGRKEEAAVKEIEWRDGKDSDVLS